VPRAAMRRGMPKLSPLLAFVATYALLYAGFGMQSPFVPARHSLTARVDRFARLRQALGEERHQAPFCHFEAALARVRVEPHDRRILRRRHVPGRLKVRQRSGRAEHARERLSGQEAGISSTHAPYVVPVVAFCQDWHVPDLARLLQPRLASNKQRLIAVAS